MPFQLDAAHRFRSCGIALASDARKNYDHRCTGDVCRKRIGPMKPDEALVFP